MSATVRSRPGFFGTVTALLREAARGFTAHKAQWSAAAIAYFATFSVAPLIIVVVEIGGLFLGHHQALLNQIYGSLSQGAGPGAAQAVKAIVVASFSQKHAGIIAQTIGWIFFVLGAIGLFSALQQALNSVWEVEAEKRGIMKLVRDRLTSFGIVLAVAFLLLVSLGLNSVLSLVGATMAHIAPFLPSLMKVVDFALSFAVITVLFALMFEFLPECRVRWRDVWWGAIVTSVLFVIGQFLLGWYLGRAAVTSSYGSFGSLVMLLLWVYYSAQILLFGAEFTRSYAAAHGETGAPAKQARAERRDGSQRKGYGPPLYGEPL